MKKRIAFILSCLLLLTALGAAVAEQETPIRYGFRGDETVEEQVVYDENGIRITATGIGIVAYAPVLCLLIENHTGMTLELDLEESSLNDWMWDALLCLYEGLDDDPDDDVYNEVGEVTVADGETLSCGLGFSNEYYYEPCGITGFGEIGFALRVIDADRGELLFVTPAIDVTTSLGADDSGAYEESGTLAYDDHGLIIRIPGVVTDEYAGCRVLVYASNASDTPVALSAERCLVNGAEMDAWFGAQLSPGKRCLAELGFADPIEEIHAFAVAFRAEEYTPEYVEEPALIGESDLIELEF